MADADQLPKAPAPSAKVTIYEVKEFPWGWTISTAEVSDRVYLGSREWRRQQQLDRVPSG